MDNFNYLGTAANLRGGAAGGGWLAFRFTYLF
jgi:hypothetical protein